MQFILNYFKGILIGAGAIIPGISSGVICIIFGIYEKLLNSILNFFDNWKKNLKFLLPIILGGITGIVCLSNIILLLFEIYPEITSFTFAGLILGCIPSLFKICNQKNIFKFNYIFFFIFSFFIALFMLILEKNFPNIPSSISVSTFSLEYLIFCGFFMSIGVVIPGVSSTIILMLLGIYETYLHSISTLNFQFLIPIGIGLIIGCLIFMKLLQFLLKKYHSQTYYSILGFSAGSIFVIIPTISMNLNGLISCVFCIIGFAVSFIISNYKNIH